MVMRHSIGATCSFVSGLTQSDFNRTFHVPWRSGWLTNQPLHTGHLQAHLSKSRQAADSTAAVIVKGLLYSQVTGRPISQSVTAQTMTARSNKMVMCVRVSISIESLHGSRLLA